MKLQVLRSAVVLAFYLALAPSPAGAQESPAAKGEVFKAQVRAINYATPLAPRNGPKAVIVYGKDAPWTASAAQAVQKAIQDWSGAKLQIADDRTVTSDESWLLTDAYRQTPLIVLGNARDNRVMHALGTRFLLQSNRTWPGGDRFIIRSVFEPFVANVNYVAMEASGETGMAAATARFAEVLQSLDAQSKAEATVPAGLRVIGAGKDKWNSRNLSLGGNMPREWAATPQASIPELIKSFKGQPFLPGSPFMNSGWADKIQSHLLVTPLGGPLEGSKPEVLTLDGPSQRAVAAMCIMGCRALGGRSQECPDHYGGLPSLNYIRAIFQAGILSPQELAELESALMHTATDPGNYVYINIAAADPTYGRWANDRHFQACLLTSVEMLDYLISHCRLDDRTRQEVARRRANAHEVASRLAMSFRDNPEGDSFGEDTVMHLYTMLHEGFMSNVRDGLLRRSADMYILTSDNIHIAPRRWGSYIGLDGFSSGPGHIISPRSGGSLVSAAAFYYDDPQYRWLVRRQLPQGGTGTNLMSMLEPFDTPGQVQEATRYYGVYSLPFDRRVYDTLTHADWQDQKPRIAPEPFEKAADRVAFRDGFEPDDAYLFLATSQSMKVYHPVQNNGIPRYTDLGDLWLFQNTSASGWSRNVVSISNGKPYTARAGCTVEAMANLGSVSAVTSKEEDNAGADWYRTIVHLRGHYFVVLDRMEARADDRFAYVCRWRSLQSAALQAGVWTAMGPSGNVFHIQNTDPVFQTSETWDVDGATRPCVLQQYKQATLAKGQAQTYQNLLYVSGQRRPDQFQARRAGEQAMLVKGRTAEGEHLALIGTGGRIPLAGYETDAAIYDVMDNQLHLAGVTMLRAPLKGAAKEILHASGPVNLWLDLRSGKGRLEVRGGKPVDVAIGGGPAAAQKPGTADATLAQAGELGEVSAALEAMWQRAKAPTTGSLSQATEQAGLQATTAPQKLQRPLRRITNGTVTAEPAWEGRYHDGWFWGSHPKLEITLTFPEPREVGCLRLPGVVKPPPDVRGRPLRGAEWSGNMGPAYEKDDFRFSLVLSDDGFKSDVRTVAAPTVTMEERPDIDVFNHSTIRRLPAWRIQVGQRARQIRIVAVPTMTPPKAMKLVDLEVYGPKPVEEMRAKACVADINGDGANELVVATSEKEVAAFDAAGRQLWRKSYPGEIMCLAAADQDGDGKAETLAYLATERLVRINGDGSERGGGDICQAQRDASSGASGIGGISHVFVWSPDGENRKEALLTAETTFRVPLDGSVKFCKLPHAGMAACGELVNFYPGEPRVLAMVNHYAMMLLSARRDAEGNYPTLVTREMPVDTGAGYAFGWIKQVNLPDQKGFLAAIEGGVAYFPQAAFAKGARGKAAAWGFDTGGVPAVAAMLEDFNGRGSPQVYLARLDGFINVFKVADGSQGEMISVGEPILGMVAVKVGGDKPRMVVGTRFSVHVYAAGGGSAGLRKIASFPLTTPATAFAGPVGKEANQVCVVATDGSVQIISVK